MFARIYSALGAAMVAGYMAIAVTGWEPMAPEQQVLPASVRQSPGGYRSFHFWHSGFHGGK